MASPPSSGPAFTIAVQTGRVIEARMFGLRTVDHANAYAEALGTHVLRMPRDVRPILCADHRPVSIYAPPVADRLVQLFSQMNARLLRVAILAARSNASLVMQLDRLVREAVHPGRRVFYGAEEAQGHLAPVLDAAELRRVRAFLAEYQPKL